MNFEVGDIVRCEGGRFSYRITELHTGLTNPYATLCYSGQHSDPSDKFIWLEFLEKVPALELLAKAAE